MSRYAKFAQKEHSLNKRLLALLPAGVLFLFLLPYVIIVVGPNMDQRLGLEGSDAGAANWILGGLMMLVGFTFAMWSIYAELDPRAGHAATGDAHPGAADRGTLPATAVTR